MSRKISELTSEEFLDVLCEITPYVSNIVSDAALMETVGKAVSKKEEMTKAGVFLLGAEKMSALIPIIAKTHRADLYGIVAGINGMTAESVASQNILKTGLQIRDIVRDKELLSFFKSFAELEETA